MAADSNGKVLSKIIKLADSKNENISYYSLFLIGCIASGEDKHT